MKTNKTRFLEKMVSEVARLYKSDSIAEMYRGFWESFATQNKKMEFWEFEYKINDFLNYFLIVLSEGDDYYRDAVRTYESDERLIYTSDGCYVGEIHGACDESDGRCFLIEIPY